MRETVREHPLALWLAAVDKTACDFAREMKVSKAYISLILNGRRCPQNLLLRISQRTGIPYDRLRGASCVRGEAA